MKKYIPIIVGIALPIIFIGVLWLLIFFPKMSMNPQYDFLYSQNNYYRYEFAYKNIYIVQNNKLMLVPNPNFSGEESRYLTIKDAPELYRYNIKEDTSNLVTFEDIKDLEIQTGPSSPDGYTVSYTYGHNGIFELFGSSSSNRGYILSKGTAQKILPAMISRDYWNDEFQVIGWIK